MVFESPDFCARLSDGSNAKALTQKLRVLVVDDHLMVRQCVRVVLEGMLGLEVVGEASDGWEALALVRTLTPDLVFMDIEMPGPNGIEVTRQITEAFPGVGVVILSSHTEEFYHRLAQKAGAAGYLVKGSSESMAADIARVLNCRRNPGSFPKA